MAVANGALVPGIAGQRAGDLIALGYVDPAAVNTAESAVTVVYAAPGFDAEAARLIDDIGSASTAILAIDAAPSLDPPVEFDLLWVLGTDQRTEG